MTASGKAESTEEATVYADDLNVFVTMMLAEDSLAVLSLGLLQGPSDLRASIRSGPNTGRGVDHEKKANTVKCRVIKKTVHTVLF